MTLPSGQTRDGICTSGFTFASSSIEDLSSHVAAETMRCGMPAMARAISMAAEPLPWWP
jgi:hypothetical protein